MVPRRFLSLRFMLVCDNALYARSGRAEQRFRPLIEERLRQPVGPRLYRQRSYSRTLEDRQTEDRDGRPAYSPIRYADLMESDVIGRNDK